MVMSESQTPQDDGSRYLPGQHPALPPPPGTVGLLGWLRKNLFNGPINSIATLIVIGLAYLVIVPIVNWLIVDSVVTGTDRRFCDLGRSAALIGENASIFNSEDYQFNPKAEGLTEAQALRQQVLQKKSAAALSNVVGLIGAFDDNLLSGDISGFVRGKEKSCVPDILNVTQPLQRYRGGHRIEILLSKILKSFGIDISGHHRIDGRVVT